MDLRTEGGHGIAQLVGSLGAVGYGDQSVKVEDGFANLGRPRSLGDEHDESRHSAGQASGRVGDGFGSSDIRSGVVLELAHSISDLAGYAAGNGWSHGGGF